MNNMEEKENLKILNIEELQEKEKDARTSALMNGIFGGMEATFAALRLYSLVTKFDILSILFGPIFTYWTYTFIRDMIKNNKNAIKYENELRHRDEEEYKNINEASLEDESKKEKMKSYGVGTLGFLTMLASFFGITYSLESHNLQICLASIVSSGLGGYFLKKMNEFYNKANIIDEDIKLIKG